MDIRASKVPLLMACPPSHSEGMRIDTDNAAARLGSAVHDGLRAHVLGQEMPSRRDLMGRYGLADDQADDLGILLHRGVKAWSELAEHFPQPEVELLMQMPIGTTLGNVILSGHCDVLSSADQNQIRVLDWKTGRKHSNYFAQLVAYALLGLCRVPAGTDCDVSCTVVWLREGAHETLRLTSRDAARFFADLQAAVAAIGGDRYQVGDHCEHCPRFHQCPARTALVRSSIRDIAGIDAESIRALGDRLPEVYAGVKCAAAAIEQFRVALRDALAGGQITSGGKVYELATVEKRLLDPRKAWPVAQARLNEEEIAPAVKLSLTALLDAVSAKAPRGAKGRRKEEFTNELEAAGAITIKPETRVSERAVERATIK